MTIEQRRYQRRPRFRLAGDETSSLIKRKILHATRIILRLARVLFNHRAWSSRVKRGISQSESGAHKLLSVIEQLVRDPSLRSG